MNEKLILQITGSIAELEKSLDQVKGKVSGLKDSVKASNKELDKTDKQVKKLDKSSSVFREIDALTNGIASGFVDVVENIGNAITAVKGLRTALITTGIGALLVAVGLLVAKWDDVKAAVASIDPELVKLTDRINRRNELNSDEIKLLRKQRELAGLQGKDTEEINRKLKERLSIQRNSLRTELAAVEAQLDSLIIAEARVNGISNALSGVGLGGIFKEIFGEDEKTFTDLRDRINDLKLEVADADLDLERFNQELEKSDKAGEKAKAGYEKVGDGLDFIKEKTALAVKELRDFNDFLNKGQFETENIGLGIDDREIKELEELLDTIRDFPGFENLSDAELVKFVNLGIDGVKRLSENYTKAMEQVKVVSNAATAGIRDIFNELYAQLQTGNAFFDAFINFFITAFEQLTTQLITSLITQKAVDKAKVASQFGPAQAAGITAATQTAASLPFGAFALPALLASTLATISGAFAGISAFATGGFSGDRNLIRANGNELILNPNQSANLFNLLRGAIPASTLGARSDGAGSGGEQVLSTRLRGSDLLIAVERAKRKSQRYSG